MGNLGPTELIIIAVVIILLFGAKKLPDMARSLGKSAKIFKAETKGLRDNQDADDAPVQQQPVQQPVQQLPPAQPQVQQQPVVAPPIEQTTQNKAANN
ncbi:Sec-independent protein translocase subunit TatA [Lentzea sp. BCCO 10_0061]|jgi:sec-independent protein translocase protein TatA|uniref:Sec-independent protein translocase protein TatA n=1 Tax=Lentzea sokolovensis TaxID=3095429 RepID=A0ABU4UPJ9_9PSEU|nr:Sec-independent protein translocase subunit TatA [Lentzea sp. BCCO 10_0061]MDX8140748.1 Sec-independent protein translocase subunit TatA [Lentzea sp. BCCO 10_0061]